MHILVTNDDGVSAPGLLALAQEMKKLGEISVLAPDRNWSASGHVKTLHRPLRITRTQLSDGTPALASDGAPSDCVALALLGALEGTIDIVVSGINPNANVGHDVTYSGTVTAAMEAVIGGVQGIAFSLDRPDELTGPLDFGPSARIARLITEKVIEMELPSNTLLNVNIPYLPEDQIKGFLLTRQGQRVYHDQLDPRSDPRGKVYYWIGGDPPTGVPEDGTDIGALLNKYVSVTPLHLDLTNYQALKILQDRDWQSE